MITEIKLLGAGIIAMVFVVIFFYMAKRVGWKAVFIAWGLSLLIAALIALGVYLITGKL